jgi:hypothetical protein
MLLGPPAWKIGVSPVFGLPEPSIRFAIDVGCPNQGLKR